MLLLLQVGLETLCVIICSLMLVSVFKTGKRYVSDEEEAEFMARCREFIKGYRWEGPCFSMGFQQQHPAPAPAAAAGAAVVTGASGLCSMVAGGTAR